MSVEMIFSLLLGVGLSASSGFRVFVPLFVLSCASYFGLIALNDSWVWLASLPALVILAVASIVEAVSYLVPFVDNLLDSIAVPLAGIAGTLVMASSLTDVSPAMTWALAIVAGGGMATGVKGSLATARAVTTATTAGVANPVVSVAETGTAIGLSVLSIFAPILTVVVLFIGLIGFIVLVKKLKQH